jgi:hypothetical protein
LLMLWKCCGKYLRRQRNIIKVAPLRLVGKLRLRLCPPNAIKVEGWRNAIKVVGLK